MIRFTADLHLGGSQVAGWRYGRWVGNVAHHDRMLAAAWDATVADEDEVWILGDLIGEMAFEPLFEWLDARPGTKHLVKGNNDVGMDFSDLPLASVYENPVMIGIGPYYEWVALSHYPTTPVTVPSGVLLHGHTHRKNDRGGWLDKEHDQVRVHVGWDAWKCIVPVDEVLSFIREVRHG